MGNSRELERKSSAVTLSDMEIFIFPQLMYGLLLANMMSPRIWRWREDPWFDGLEKMKPYRRITRLKQYIMDHYVFNLDLDTWGLTTKERELARFADFIDIETLKRSNALFGYEGDKYYFDIDIRTHFGLDKYEGDVIPYWKTETVEAMDAFRHKPNYTNGAGECVSLAALYAAALFIVARIPLEDIYLMATPLHSQNYVDTGTGILTNNRRLVTRNMWYNGTALSAQARRALENERVTIVTHCTGAIHTIYDEATISPADYDAFSTKLRKFLQTGLTQEILGNFLRHSRDLQKCFQMRWPLHGVDHFIGIETVMAYEHGSPFKITDKTRDKLMAEIDAEEFQVSPMPGRIVLNELETFVRENHINIADTGDANRLRKQFASDCLNATIAIESLTRFCRVEPRLPANKRFVEVEEPLNIGLDMDREALIRRLETIRERNETADLAFYAYRDLTRSEPEAFLVAATQRCPVSVMAAAELDGDLYATVSAMPSESIYDEDGRLAQPDEVWNYGRGDGVEKAVLMANILRASAPDEPMTIEIEGGKAALKAGTDTHEFTTTKNLPDQVWQIPSLPPSLRS